MKLLSLDVIIKNVMKHTIGGCSRRFMNTVIISTNPGTSRLQTMSMVFRCSGIFFDRSFISHFLS